jgi:hypothetical protein
MVRKTSASNAEPLMSVIPKTLPVSTETSRMHLILFGSQKRIFGLYLAAISRILIFLCRKTCFLVVHLVRFWRVIYLNLHPRFSRCTWHYFFSAAFIMLFCPAFVHVLWTPPRLTLNAFVAAFFGTGGGRAFHVCRFLRPGAAHKWQDSRLKTDRLACTWGEEWRARRTLTDVLMHRQVAEWARPALRGCLSEGWAGAL